MARTVDCLFCFETLYSSLTHQNPSSLGQVEDLYEQYFTYQNAAAARQKLEEDTIAGRLELDHKFSGDFAEAEVEEHGTSSTHKSTAIRKSRRLPAHDSSNKLAAPSISPGSSTPSSASNASSSISTPSSRSSASSKTHDLRSRSERRTVEPYHPMFITWNTISRSGSKNLRGCIGTFEAQPMEQGLRTYALTSAFDDTRFHPITLNELASLECCVTFLTDFEPASSPMDWDIGTHGLRISFTWHSKRYGATYLPDVAREQGWTKTETLISLMRKAGWSGRQDEWTNVRDLDVVRYQGNKVDLSYEQWKSWKDWTDLQKKMTATSN